MLIIARGALGLTQKELSEATGISQGQISKLENGLQLELSDETVAVLAEVLEVLPSFFRRTDSRRSLPISMYRQQKSMGKKQGAQLESIFNKRKMDLSRLFQSVDISPACEIPDLDPDLVGGPEEAARQARAALRIPMGPIRDLIPHLEDAGIVIIPMDLPPKIDGLSCEGMDGSPPLIFFNRNMPFDRVIFTLAHEFGHLCMHRIPSEFMEPEADAFAAEFLMPEAIIRSELHALNLRKLARLKMKWRVSMQSLLKRAKTLRTMTPGQQSYLWRKLSKNGYRRNEPVELEPSEPTLLQVLLAVYFEELDYTVEQLAQALDRPVDILVRDFKLPMVAVEGGGNADPQANKPSLRLLR